MVNRFINKLCGFAKLTDPEIEALALATSTPLMVDARQDLIREGDQPGPIFVVLESWAFRYKVLPNGSRQVMAFLMPGDACERLGDDGGLKATYRGGCRACQNLPRIVSPDVV